MPNGVEIFLLETVIIYKLIAISQFISMLIPNITIEYNINSEYQNLVQFYIINLQFNSILITYAIIPSTEGQ